MPYLSFIYPLLILLVSFLQFPSDSSFNSVSKLISPLYANPPGSSSSSTSSDQGLDHPFLWEVKNAQGTTSYLFGTIHIPNQRFKILHPSVNQALEEIEALYGELDLNDKIGLQSALMTKAMLPPNKTLKSVVGETLYADLDAYFKSHNSSLTLFNRLNPMMIEVMISMIELLPLFAKGEPALDELLMQKARASGKEVGGIETMQEQLDALFSKTEKESVESLKVTLKLYKEKSKQGKTFLNTLFASYLSGDEKRVDQDIKEELKHATSAQKRTFDHLLNRRNRTMAKRMIEKMKKHPQKQYFFAFGVAHFIGDQRIQIDLEKAGFSIKRLHAPR